MLINSLDKSHAAPLLVLESLPVICYLTGRRYFNSFRQVPLALSEYVHYDYFCEYNEHNLKMVKEAFPLAVFVKASEVNMHIHIDIDDNTVEVAVMIKGDQEIRLHFVKNVKLKIEVQRILAAMGDVFNNSSKSTQRKLWCAQYNRICEERNIEL